MSKFNILGWWNNSYPLNPIENRLLNIHRDNDCNNDLSDYYDYKNLINLYFKSMPCCNINDDNWIISCDNCASNHIDKWASSRNIQLNQNQKDAIASACYNFGIGFLNKPIAKLIAQDPNNSQIPNMWAHLSDAQGSKYPGLIKRRQTEAAWYAGNIA